MKGHWVTWTPAELDWIKAHVQVPRREALAAFQQRFDRPDVSLINFASLCKRKGWTTGRTGRFEKGQAPANKGQKMPFNANSARTQFKTGHAPHNTKFLGHERVSKDGYVEISIAETDPHTGFERRYVLKHRWLWERANGTLPPGMCLKCLDSNRQNTDPANWVAVPRAALPHLSGGRWKAQVPYDQAPPEVKPSLLALARLKARLNEEVR